MLEFDRLPVTEQGVVLPKSMFGQAKEVAVRWENGCLLIKAVDPNLDPPLSDRALIAPSIWCLGSDPIWDDPISDSSVNHDQRE